MKKLPLIAITALSFGCFNLGIVAHAQTPLPLVKPPFIELDAAAAVSLGDAIREAIRTNPDILSSLKSVELAVENIDLARSGYRPDVAANVSVTHLQNDTDTQGDWKGNTAKSAGVSLTQPLYRGGRTTAEIEEKKALFNASELAFSTDVHDKITESVWAYMNVFESLESVKANKNNKNRQNERYKAAKAGASAGELTRTDVSQARARFAEAKAEYIVSKASLDVAYSNFRKVTGIRDDLDLSYPQLDLTILPESLDEALLIAELKNPTLRAAYEKVRAQGYYTKQKNGSFMPEVNLGASLDAMRDPAGGGFDRENSASVSLSATLPLYQSGVLRNQLRQAKIKQAQVEADLEAVRRAIEDRVITAWGNYNMVSAQIDARQAQLDAASVARKGATLEHKAGARSVLDVLDANQDVRDARLLLIQAKKDAVINYYELLAAMGRFDSSLWDNLQTSL